MSRGGLNKRVLALEQQTGYGLPEVKLIQVNHRDYLEKQLEIEQAEDEGFQVLSLVSIGVNDETEHPEYFKYCQTSREKGKHEK